MESKGQPAVAVLAVCCGLGMWTAFALAQGSDQRNRSAQKQQQASAPVSFERLRDAIPLYANGARGPLDRAVADVEKYGVDFSWPKFAELEAMNPPIKTLDAVKRAITLKYGAKPPPPPPPPPPPKGQLWLKCDPPECNIQLDGKPSGSTESGVFRKESLPLAVVTVLLLKTGYLPARLDIKVRENPDQPESVTLQLDPQQRRVFGEQLRSAMLQALGVGSGAAARPSLESSGSITEISDGKTTEWRLRSIAWTPPHSLKIAAGSIEGTLSVDCENSLCTPAATKRSFLGAGGGKQLKGPAAERLDIVLKQYARYDFAAILDQISAQAVVTADRADLTGKDPQTFRVEFSDEWYDVTLGTDLLPSLVEYTSKAGVNSGLKLTYAKYVKVGAIQFPTRTNIGQPGGAGSGLQVQLQPPAVPAGSKPVPAR